MSAEYAIGTVARATVEGVEDTLVMGALGTDGIDTAFVWMTPEPVGHHHVHTRAAVTDIRPLVVLDMYEAPNGVGTMIRALRAGDHPAKWVADQIEAQTKPTEPTGLGAVVEDADGKRWVRIDGDIAPWAGRGCFPQKWQHIEAVRVLSEGVPA